MNDGVRSQVPVRGVTCGYFRHPQRVHQQNARRAPGLPALPQGARFGAHSGRGGAGGQRDSRTIDYGLYRSASPVGAEMPDRPPITRTFPSGKSVVAVKRPVFGSYNSEELIGCPLMSWRPATRTWPFGSRVAVWKARASLRSPVRSTVRGPGVTEGAAATGVPLVAGYSVGVADSSAGKVGSKKSNSERADVPLEPPTMRTVSSGSPVAVCEDLPARIVPSGADNPAPG